MTCPYCSADISRVVDKRESADNKYTRRRRECLKCKRRYTTFERVETLDLLIVKKDGQRELLDRGKIRSGVIRACEKRPISADDIEKLVDEVEGELRKKGDSEISSKRIGSIVSKKLKKLDKIAYIRFASVYRQFADIGDFEKELALFSKKFKK